MLHAHRRRLRDRSGGSRSRRSARSPGSSMRLDGFEGELRAYRQRLEDAERRLASSYQSRRAAHSPSPTSSALKAPAACDVEEQLAASRPLSRVSMGMEIAAAALNGGMEEKEEEEEPLADRSSADACAQRAASRSRPRRPSQGCQPRSVLPGRDARPQLHRPSAPRAGGVFGRRLRKDRAEGAVSATL
jgi:hypothetical protein